MQVKKIRIVILLLLLIVDVTLTAAQKRIITLSGALTETVAALGYQKQIVATDVTSIYPDFVKQLPKVSRNRQLSAESLMSFAPDLILAPEGDVSREIVYQLKAAGIKLVTFKQNYSVEGATRFIKQVAMALGNVEKGNVLAAQTLSKTNAVLTKIKANPIKKQFKVLFIYARGAGTMTVAGRNSNLDAIIGLAGATNAVKEFTDFKPYSTEMLVKANPDAILMFDFGANSLGGKKSILQLPGMSATQAGKQKRIIEMDGQLLINFSVRLPQAIAALHEEFYN